MSKKQYTLAYLFGVQYADSRFSRAGSTLHKSDSLTFLTHLHKICECFFLMLTQFKNATLLSGCITVKIGKNWRIAKEGDQLVLDTVRSLGKLGIRPTEYTPPLKHHAVLLK